MIAKCSSIGAHSFTIGGIGTGEEPHCIHCGMTAEEALREDSVTHRRTDRVLDQLRANAKAHKKQIDKLTARLGQATQQRDDAAAQLMVKEQEAAFYKATLEPQMAKRQPEPFIKPSGLEAAAVSWLVGFSLTAGGVVAYALAKLMGVL